MFPVVIAVVVVLMAVGFACGWYVRGAYVRRYMKRRLKAQRQAFVDRQFAMVEQSIHEATKHNVFPIPTVQPMPTPVGRIFDGDER